MDNLNIGGLIGALVCGGIVGVIVFMTFDPTHTSRRPFKLVILAVIGGAVGGNFLWRKLIQKS